MVRALDEGVANVTAALRARGMLEDTLIVFSTDNGGPADEFNGNMASNWPLRGTKRTLFEGGVRGVGFVAGAGISPSRRGTTLTGLVHAADWMPTLLSAAAAAAGSGLNTTTKRAHSNSSSSSSSWRNGVLLGPHEPPFQLGDGQDLWAYLSGDEDGGDPTVSPRTEVLHEAHPHDSTDGNGNALRVGDWKVVLRSGAMWAAATRLGSNDGWFGGPNSSDPVTDGYALPKGQKTQPWTIQCKTPPASITEGFPCERKMGKGADKKEFACLFNIRDDPCEMVCRSHAHTKSYTFLFHYSHTRRCC